MRRKKIDAVNPELCKRVKIQPLHKNAHMGNSLGFHVGRRHFKVKILLNEKMAEILIIENMSPKQPCCPTTPMWRGVVLLILMILLHMFSKKSHDWLTDSIK